MTISLMMKYLQFSRICLPTEFVLSSGNEDESEEDYEPDSDHSDEQFYDRLGNKTSKNMLKFNIKVIIL